MRPTQYIVNTSGLGVPCSMQSGKGWDEVGCHMSDVVRVSGKYRLKERIGSGTFGA
jgi:hypothetical protein